MGAEGRCGVWFTDSLHISDMLKVCSAEHLHLLASVMLILTLLRSAFDLPPPAAGDIQVQHPDGRTIATGQVGHDPGAIIWDAEDMHTTQTIPQG